MPILLLNGQGGGGRVHCLDLLILKCTLFPFPVNLILKCTSIRLLDGSWMTVKTLDRSLSTFVCHVISPCKYSMEDCTNVFIGSGWNRAGRSGFKWLKSAKNNFTKCNFFIWKSSADSHSHSGHFIHFLFKIYQTVLGIYMISWFHNFFYVLIVGGFLKSIPTVLLKGS